MNINISYSSEALSVRDIFLSQRLLGFIFSSENRYKSKLNGSYEILLRV